MNTVLLEEVKGVVKNWWVSLLLGAMFVGVALWLMFANPGDSYSVLTIVFSICMFTSGMFETIFAVSNKDVLPNWGWTLACGIIDILLGLFLIANPVVTAVVIPFVLAFWIMFRGFSSIGLSIELNRIGVKGWGWYLVFGILSILCSLSIIWAPAAGALAVIYILAFAFMFMGFFRIMLAFDLRDLYKNSQKLKEKIAALKEKFD